MVADPKLIAKRLREQRKQVKDETVVLNEQLALIDVIIDEYDDLIIKLDIRFSLIFHQLIRRFKLFNRHILIEYLMVAEVT